MTTEWIIVTLLKKEWKNSMSKITSVNLHLRMTHSVWIINFVFKSRRPPREFHFLKIPTHWLNALRYRDNFVIIRNYNNDKKACFRKKIKKPRFRVPRPIFTILRIAKIFIFGTKQISNFFLYCVCDSRNKFRSLKFFSNL